MSSILFFDPLCTRPYSTRTRYETAMAGTEVTVSRVADALGAIVMQQYRTEPDGRYLPAGRMDGVVHLIVIRDSRWLPALHQRFPSARLYLWVHDRIFPGTKRGRHLAAQAKVLRGMDLTIICVSDWQRQGVEGVLKQLPGCGHIRVRTIYNAIEDSLAPDHSAIDRSKLVFFSSPNKGLSYTLDAFQALRQRMPDLRLYVANPGYKKLPSVSIDGVEWLGALPNPKVLAEVRSALCVFYPNFVLPETFGLVFAEANAVGTPVLTHACGAAHEIIADSRQVLPVTASQKRHERFARLVPVQWRRTPARCAAKLGVFDPYIERIAAWRNGERPRTQPDMRFRFSSIAEQWRVLFNA
jgi:glycosyltransferase involved in cell wall biosynthesis